MTVHMMTEGTRHGRPFRSARKSSSSGPTSTHRRRWDYSGPSPSRC
ncbi:MAG: hypothetical protein M0C28_16765 [Candidatus Moduliflexus flocculans]|nr:hypothetical protein [Candidatus Moduliflexus flocculans]